MHKSPFFNFVRKTLRYLKSFYRCSSSLSSSMEQFIFFWQRILVSDLEVFIPHPDRFTLGCQPKSVHSGGRHRLTKPAEPHHQQKLSCKLEVIKVDAPVLCCTSKFCPLKSQIENVTKGNLGKVWEWIRKNCLFATGLSLYNWSIPHRRSPETQS